MKKKYLVFAALSILMLPSCDKTLVEWESGQVCVEVSEGNNWLHDYPLLMGIKKKNPPQIAIWVEDTSGRYVSSIYVSRKIATHGWVGAHGNDRKEALPYWSHVRGERENVDALTGATPRETFNTYFCEKTGKQQFRVMVEVNHSTDFNDLYSKDLPESSPYYSGGEEGSGQPALVYQANVDLCSEKKSFTASLIGHSSPDGTDGDIHTDMEGITSAYNIVKQITVKLK